MRNLRIIQDPVISKALWCNARGTVRPMAMTIVMCMVIKALALVHVLVHVTGSKRACFAVNIVNMFPAVVIARVPKFRSPMLSKGGPVAMCQRWRD